MIGPMVNVRLPEDLIEALDKIAEYHEMSRAGVIRMILTMELEDPEGGYTTPGYGSRYTDRERSR